MSSESIQSLEIYKNGLIFLIKEVKNAAESAKVSPKGFKIDESFCDYGQISVSKLVSGISLLSDQFSMFNIDNDLFIEFITDDITEYFS
jgi:hypothetical protein